MIIAENLKVNELQEMLNEIDRLYFDENLKLEDAIRQIKEKKESEQN